jgi:hypothetical protein
MSERREKKPTKKPAAEARALDAARQTARLQARVTQLEMAVAAEAQRALDAEHRTEVLEATLVGHAQTIEGWKAAAEMAETLKQITPVITALAVAAQEQPALEADTTRRSRWRRR